MGVANSKNADLDMENLSIQMKQELMNDLFRTLDENESKKLDFNEFCAVWTMIGLKPNNRKTKVTVFENYDVNKDGAIDTKEFKTFLDSLVNEGKEDCVDDIHEWGYEKHNGPDTWCHHYDAAQGVCQSPIDVKLNTVQNKKKPMVTCHYKNCDAICLNNSHTVVWSVENAGFIAIEGKKFKLAQFHYHCPSEHWVNGKPYPLCLHFVHVADDGTLAVLGRTYEYSRKSDSFIDAAISCKPLKSHESCDIRNVPFSRLDVNGEYVTYDGSLTTPPCSEGVLWHVKSKAGTITYAQENWFRSCLSFDNARPLQNLNGRELVSVDVLTSDKAREKMVSKASTNAKVDPFVDELAGGDTLDE